MVSLTEDMRGIPVRDITSYGQVRHEPVKAIKAHFDRLMRSDPRRVTARCEQENAESGAERQDEEAVHHR